MRRFPWNSMRSIIGPVCCGATGVGGAICDSGFGGVTVPPGVICDHRGIANVNRQTASDSKPEMLAPENRSEVLCAAGQNFKAAPPKPNLFALRRPGRDGLWA